MAAQNIEDTEALAAALAARLIHTQHNTPHTVTAPAGASKWKLNRLR
jgi:hypothetical protein